MNSTYIVTGSRDWNDLDSVWSALENAFSQVGNDLMYVVHGDCPRGADAMAQAWVDHKDEPDIIAVRYPAQWETFGRRAGHVRNQLMVDQGADEVLAFIRNNSPGASGLVRMARKAGIPVSLVRIDDKEKRVTETKTKTTVVEPKHEDIYHALVAFQAEMKTVGKGNVNLHFKSRYADITSLTEEVMPLLTKHGLAFTCLPRSTDNGYEIQGILLHESGGRLEAALPLFGNDAQKIGSSITYARRYLLGSVTGVVTGNEPDDDGDMAATTSQRVERQPINRAASKPKGNPAEILAEVEAAATKDEVRALWTKYNLDAAPADFQAKIQQIALGLPEADE